jgi:VIT1/CCC1 family predicted Fe2+/Mn2+ transporter
LIAPVRAAMIRRAMASASDVRRYRQNWQSEIDSAAEYRAMAEEEETASVAEIYRKLAATEERHAHFWATRLQQSGSKVGRFRPSWRARTLVFLARRFGARAILPTIAAKERVDRDVYASQPEARGTDMTVQEHTHARVLRMLLSQRRGAEGSALARVEGRHRTVGGNALRAAVLGANDGLCSNLSLVMGVAGTTASTHALLVTGAAGLLAGACSMALGEWVSVTSSRELTEREIGIEAGELESAPEDEREELELIYQAKGVAPDESRELARQLMADPKTALDVLTREELGIDPEDRGGSPLTAAFSSFTLFAIGAVIPVAPLLFLEGNTALIASLVAGGVGLLAIGAAITLFTGRPVWASAGRQLLLGFAAAAVTFGLGRLLGVAIAG